MSAQNLKNLLAFAIQAQTELGGTTTTTTTEGNASSSSSADSSVRTLTEEDLQFLCKALECASNDPFDTVKRCLVTLSDTSKSEEEVVDALETLAEEVEDLNKTVFLTHEPKYFDVLLSYADNSSPSVRGNALLCLGNAWKSHPPVQKLANERPVLEVLLKMLSNEEEKEKVKFRVLGALSGLLTANRAAMAKMLRLHGLRYVYPMLAEGMSVRFVNKALFLIRNVLRENPNVCEVAVRSTLKEFPFARLLQLVGYNNEFQTCELVADLISILMASKTARAELMRLGVETIVARRLTDILNSTEEDFIADSQPELKSLQQILNQMGN